MAEGPARIIEGERALFTPAAVDFAPVAPGPASPTAPAIPEAAARSPRRSPARLPPPAAQRDALVHAVSKEVDRGTPFILAPAVMGCGALFYFGMVSEPPWLPLTAGAMALLPLTLATRRWPLAHYALVAALLFLVGILAGKAETWRAGTPMLGGEISTLLTARVASVERQASGRVRLTLDVVATERPTLRYAPDRVRVSARNVPEGIAPGALVSGLVRLMPPAGPVRPGSYDFSFESYFDGIGASGFFLRGPELSQGEAPEASASLRFRAAVQDLRERIARRIENHIGGPEGGIAAALVVGVRAGIPNDISEDLRRSGIYHVISISGLHMALVAGTVMGLLRFGFALFPDFASRRPVKKLSAALAILALSAYLLLSGGEVAAQRSFIMLAVMLTAVLFDRAALTMRNLAISALVVILVSPHEIVGPSFQMSFAATAALVGAYAAWEEFRQRRPSAAAVSRPWPARLFRLGRNAVLGLAATSLVAGGATAVYSAYHFQQMPSLGLFTNLAAMPVVSLLVMPFAVLGTLAIPFGLDGPFFWVMGEGLRITVAIARWFSARSPIDIVGLVAPSAVVLVTIALLFATVATTWLRLLAVPAALAGLLTLGTMPRPEMLVSEDGRLVGIDLGQGRIAVNRARPNAFTVDNWQRAMRADEVIPPVMGARNGAGFACSDACVGHLPSGALVAHAKDAASAARYCASAAAIIVDDPTVRNLCPGSAALVVTGRDVARLGSAEIRLPEVRDGEGEMPAQVTYAIRTPYRPWHEQRRFSRAARGVPPSERRPADQQSPLAAISTITESTENEGSGASDVSATAGQYESDGL